MESRYGALGSGAQNLSINGVGYALAELMFRLGIGFDDSRAIDVLSVSDGRYAVRYYDGQDQRVVAHEFDAEFHFLGETRAHIAEWIGEEAYFSLYGGH